MVDILQSLFMIMSQYYTNTTLSDGPHNLYVNGWIELHRNQFSPKEINAYSDISIITKVAQAEVDKQIDLEQTCIIVNLKTNEGRVTSLDKYYLIGISSSTLKQNL